MVGSPWPLFADAMIPVIAIIDVGKTNKKLFLFNQQYEIVWEQSEQFAEISDEDGDPGEDLSQLTNWVLASLNAVLVLPAFDLQAINVTTYGASLVYIDAEGRPIGQLYNYLKPFPEAVRQRFLQQYGPADTLSQQMASPWLDSLNAGLMLYRIKYDKPRLFRRIWHALHLPQYVSYLITRQCHSDLTSIGCHTMLWNFGKRRYHDWVVAEGLDTLFGPLFPSDQALRALMIDPPTDKTHPLKVGVGLHDSSAALIPYIASFQEPFVLISTGTWCISMNPFVQTDGPEPALTADELAQDCLYYMQYKGKPVKASRLFAGYEHEQQTSRLAAYFNVPTDYYTCVRYDKRVVDQLKRESKEAAVPSEEIADSSLSISLGGSAFGGRDLQGFADYETAYHRLMMDLMDGQIRSTSLVFPMNAPVSRIFVDGGFSRNTLYMNLLAAAFPQVEVWAASVAQATALGAALAFHDQWNPLPVSPNLITLTHYALSPANRPQPATP